ncbi:MAG TPA: hypothetical protein DHW02_18885, partial [Ktedonobacter sp.]|nr:hypothetical protein [Ktedonobacter sp.]
MEDAEGGDVGMIAEDEERKQQEQTLLNGRYRITQRLASRPHLTLYLGKRLPQRTSRTIQSHGSGVSHQQESLVAIRELVLSDFSPITRAQIEAAAVEEFASPTVFNSSHLPRSGDRAWRENDCLYLALQLDTPFATSTSLHMYPFEPVTLDRMLLDSRAWPTWLNVQVVVAWGIQLCRMIARLHHQGVVLGNLNPSTILVYPHVNSSSPERMVWEPLLLPCWPPAPCYWQGGRSENQTYQMFVAHDYATSFPIGRNGSGDAFSAPEMLHESRTEVTERADIYSLGAILYLLLTHYAPVCAASRVASEQHIYSSTFDTPRGTTLVHPLAYSISLPAVRAGGVRTRFARRRQTQQAHQNRFINNVYSVYEEQSGEEQGLELLDLRTLNSNIPAELAEIVLRALEL